MKSFKVAGAIVLGVVALLAALGFAFSVAGLLGYHDTSRLVCDRAASECRVEHRFFTRHYPLASITSASLGSSPYGIGDDGSTEMRHAIVLHVSGHDRAITMWTADPQSVAQYAEALARVQRFLGGDGATLSVALTARESSTSGLEALIAGAMLLAVGWVAVRAMRKK